MDTLWKKRDTKCTAIMHSSCRPTFKEFHELSSPYKNLHDNYVSNKQGSSGLMKFLLIMASLTFLGGLLAIALLENQKNEEKINQVGNTNDQPVQNNGVEKSRIVLTESIPFWMDYGANATFGIPLYNAWKDLVSTATSQIEVASFYWSLTGEDIGVNSSTDQPGRDILEELKALPKRNVSVRVVTSIPSLATNSTDLQALKENGVQVRKVNFGHLTRGVLHSKFWVVDRKHIYIGSANMDWRALTQVKEIGVVLYNCTSLAVDLHKVFQSYWVMGQHHATIPQPWPPYYDTSINEEQPLHVNLSGVPSRVYISGSPPVFCPDSRTKDLDAILSAVTQAEQFIHIAVMEYYPASKFMPHHRYWPVIENALKQAAFERNVAVRLLVSCGRDSDPSVLPFLTSLSALDSPSNNISIEVRLHIVPVGNQTDIPYARVNHNKYMVTDKLAYIGTSNWSAEYFNTTAGVGIVVSQDALNSSSFEDTFVGQLSGVFNRDWGSEFAVPFEKLHHNPDCAFIKR
ncbi:5'-3' exonuclease PLD4 isoform X1 [Brachyhypopomus gauderio]|uniref:5'-3' exonuclease PLD4 isoform X1 n=1 Tax=Brachyhypopomus gauderio TaxID=698409 RepID=UPI0040414CF9